MVLLIKVSTGHGGKIPPDGQKQQKLVPKTSHGGCLLAMIIARKRKGLKNDIVHCSDLPKKLAPYQCVAVVHNAYLHSQSEVAALCARPLSVVALYE